MTAPPSSDGEAFEAMMAALDYPMFVVTTRGHRGGDAPAGCLVGFASQASISPPRFLVGVSKRNHTYGAAHRATHLAVHLLTRRHVHLAQLFGGQTGAHVNKFAQCAWQSGPAGMPILTDAGAWFVGRVRDRFNLGDHVGHLLEPIASQAPTAGDWVTFADVRDLEPGQPA